MPEINKKPHSNGIQYANFDGANGQGTADLFGLSNAVVVPVGSGNRVITSGTIGMRADETVPQGLDEEVEQAFKNIEEALGAAGLSQDLWKKVYKLKIYVVEKDRDIIFEAANRVSKRLLGHTKPAISAVVVPAILHPDARLELEIEALLPHCSKL
ncbi:hypothetical protein NM208_g1658 [Fusarium decemcellulare]|uniref:Uncharacterized protein n=1 Tax=Fusarium decemcellulare TaxID=57161 RepID=A0ACC1SV52_9HYPO|nr:hypothetical protein NM208_g1658 [Fusarium decemcellulare]